LAGISCWRGKQIIIFQKKVSLPTYSILFLLSLKSKVLVLLTTAGVVDDEVMMLVVGAGFLWGSGT